jgi:FtsP/CotA-like multicopper oxidase with cupredoxin domain
MKSIKTAIFAAGAVMLLSTLGAAPATQPAPAAAPALVDVKFIGVQDVFSRNAIGDAIVIDSVRGPTDKIQVGDTYQIHGAYTLASHDAAVLAAFETSDSSAPHRNMIDGQDIQFAKGSGTFTLRIKIEDPGCPHVSFYPAQGGSSFADEYFGTGDFLPRSSWKVSADGKK